MIVKNVNTQNHLDLSATFLRDILDAGKSFKSTILLKRKNVIANCRSILEILLLGTIDCTIMEIVAEGDDEMAAVEHLSEIFEGSFVAVT